jgi:hypothetical protein
VFGTSSAKTGTTAEVRERVMPLVLAALTLAWIVVSIEPFPVGVFQDDGIYTVLAKSLATGQGYRYLHMPDAPSATHYPPLYPLVLAGLWKLSPSFPANVTMFKFVNAGFAALAAIFAWRFARRQVGMGQWTAFFSAGAFTVCTPMVLLGVMVLSEPMFLAALFPVLMACERAASSGNRRDAVIAGAAGGALALIRTLGAVAIPATALVLAWRRRWLAAFLVCVAGAVVMLPWQVWVGIHGDDVPHVFLGKYGSYSGWLAEGIQAGGPVWVAKLIVFNLKLLVGQGWATLAVESLPVPVRWFATVVVTAFFAGGWWRMLHRAPVAAWMVAFYMTLVVSWPFVPARFTFAIWPIIGMIFGLAIEAVVSWRPVALPRLVMRWSAVTLAALLAVGYARYNYLGNKRGWWTQVQALTADRARYLAEWVVANTPEKAVIATDDDVLIHLYTGRYTVPNGTFTPWEHMKAQTPAFATEVLRTIMKTYRVDYVLASSDYGTYAARGLVQSNPPELLIVGALKYGAIFRPPPRSGTP